MFIDQDEPKRRALQRSATFPLPKPTHLRSAPLERDTKLLSVYKHWVPTGPATALSELTL